MNKLICWTLAVLALAGCEMGNSSDSSSDGSGGGTVASSLSGTGYYCGTWTSSAGTALNGKGYTMGITLSANGGYSYIVMFNDNSNGCATSQISGGNDAATYQESGTWSVGGASSSVANGYNVTFTATSRMMTVYPGQSSAFATYAHGSCTGVATAFSTSSTMTQDVSAMNCAGTSAYSIGGLSSLSSSYQQVIKLDTASQTLSLGTAASVYTPGYTPGAAPSSLGSVTFNGYH